MDIHIRMLLATYHSRNIYSILRTRSDVCQLLMEHLKELLAQLEKDLETAKLAESEAKEKVKSTTSQIKEVNKLIEKWK